MYAMLGRWIFSSISGISLEKQLEGRRERERVRDIERARQFLLSHDVPVSDMGDLELWPLNVTIAQYWEREEPTTQVAPGATTTVEIRRHIGLSRELLVELSSRLALGASTSVLAAEVAARSSARIVLTDEYTDTRALRLQNLGVGYRHFAIWHPVHRISIYTHHPERADMPITIKTWEFISSPTVSLSSRDVDF
jgi:hypothetical protein